MKKILNLILIILLSISTLIFTLSSLVEKGSKDITSTIVHKELETQLNQAVGEIQAIIPFDDNGSVDKLMESLKEDTEVSEAIDKYAKLFLMDLTLDTDAITTNVNEEVQTLVLKHSEEFGGLFGDVINPVYQEIIIKEIVSRIDFNSYYIKGINIAKTKLGTGQIQMVKIANQMIENSNEFRITSLILGVFISVVLLLVNKLNMKVLGLGYIVSGASLLFAYFMIPNMISTKAPQFTGVISFQSLVKNAIILLGLGIISIFLNRFKKEEK